MKSTVIQITKPSTPSSLISAEESEYLKLLISYGGGMGGSKETIYCSVQHETEHTITVKNDLTGQIITYNRRFIVAYYHEVILVKAVFDTIGHANYHGKRFKRHETTVWVEIPKGFTWDVDGKGFAPAQENIIKKSKYFESYD